MNEPAFFSRRSMGQANYFLVALAATFVVALIPVAAYKAINRSSNDIDAWLPATDEAVANLSWFRSQFDGDRMILASWDGCTLADAETLDRVAQNLCDKAPAANSRERALFGRVTTGPALLAELTAPPFNMARETAIERLEGTFVGRVASETHNGAQPTRPTCLAAFLTREASASQELRRQVVDRLRKAIAAEAQVAPAAIHLAGPGMDSVGLDEESRRTLVRLGALVCITSLGLCAWRLRNVSLATIVVGAAAISAAMSVALVFYCGIFEITALDRAAAWFGSMDALVVGVPALVYVVALSMGLRLVYYYRDARLESAAAAAEQSVGEGRPWWLITPLLLAAMLGALCVSDIVPIRRFSVFAGVGMIVSAAMVLAIVSVLLHRFPPSMQALAALGGRGTGSPPRWTEGTFQFGAGSWFAISLFCVSTLALAGWGLTFLNTAPQLPSMAGSRARLAKDYAWFGEHIGYASPLEIVLTVPIERCREAEAAAEADGQQYRLSLAERLDLMDQIAARARAVPQISGVFSPASAVANPGSAEESDEQLRLALERQGLLRADRQAGASTADCELWRMSARVATRQDARDLNYPELLDRVREAAAPVLTAYQQRDLIVRNLHERGGQLAGARISILFQDEFNDPTPRQNSQEQLLGELLNRSGVAAEGVAFVNVEALNPDGKTAQVVRERTLEMLHKQTAVVAMADAENAAANYLAADGVNIVHVTINDPLEVSQAVAAVESGGIRPIRATYAGTAPVAVALNAGLTPALWSASQMALPLLAAVMMIVAWDIVGGVLALLPILFPLGLVLGMLGWMNVRLDMGLLLSATLAVALALEGTINFLSWFRRGSAAGLFRQEAARMAYARLAPGMLNTLLIAGLGLLPLALSGIGSIQLFAILAAPIALASMVATLSLLPGMVCSPLSQFFGAAVEPQAGEATVRPRMIDGVREDLPATRPSRPHVGAAEAAKTAAVRSMSRPGDERHEGIDAPHLSLHAKLQRLRHPAGDSPAS